MSNTLEMVTKEIICANPNCRPPIGWDRSRQPDSWSRNPEGRAILPYAGVGRPPKFCGPACKQADYRARKEITDREEARAEQQRKDERFVRGIERTITHELAKLPMNSRISTTQRNELAARLARQVVQHLQVKLW